jgi:hypothetical protein
MDIVTAGRSKYGNFLLAFCDKPDDNATSGAGNKQPWFDVVHIMSLPKD